MLVLVQIFTQYSCLQKYLKVCFLLVQGTSCVDLPFFYILNYVNNFIYKARQGGNFCDSITTDDDDNVDNTDYDYNINDNNNIKNDINKDILDIT